MNKILMGLVIFASTSTFANPIQYKGQKFTINPEKVEDIIRYNSATHQLKVLDIKYGSLVQEGLRRFTGSTTGFINRFTEDSLTEYLANMSNTNFHYSVVFEGRYDLGGKYQGSFKSTECSLHIQPDLDKATIYGCDAKYTDSGAKYSVLLIKSIYGLDRLGNWEYI
jgi:hypothetical protein